METRTAEPKPAAPAKKASPAVLAVCAAILVFAVVIRIKEALELRNPVMTEAALRGRTFTIEVADTAAKRDLGLGERDSLPRDHGMYFPFDREQRWVFWMKGMRFPIDIIWIRDGRVVDIHHSVPVPKVLPLDTYRPTEPADAVLELNAGIAEEIGLRPGDLICFGTCPSDAEPAAIVMETLPEAPPPDVKTYPDEDSIEGTYANRELGLAFAYPEAWGRAEIRESTFSFDEGRRATATFTGNASSTFELFSADWALGVGEGWNQRLAISGDPKDPIGSLKEAQTRVHKDILAFKKLRNGYRFDFQFTYGATRLLAVYLAPNLLSGGDYRDAQWVAQPVEALMTKTPDEPPYDAKSAAAALARPEVASALDAIEKVFITIRPLPPTP